RKGVAAEILMSNPCELFRNRMELKNRSRHGDNRIASALGSRTVSRPPVSPNGKSHTTFAPSHNLHYRRLSHHGEVPLLRPFHQRLCTSIAILFVHHARHGQRTFPSCRLLPKFPGGGQHAGQGSFHVSGAQAPKPLP